MKQYTDARTKQAFLEGQDAWNTYANSGFQPKCEMKNIYNQNTDKELWRTWNRGWNTNLKGTD